MAEQHFFLQEKWLGSRQIETMTEGIYGLKVANSYALFCPHCATIWGKLMHDHKDSYCQPSTSCCITHASHWSDATFTLGDGNHPVTERSWSDDLPSAVKRYEVLALTTFWINNPNQRFFTKLLQHENA